MKEVVPFQEFDKDYEHLAEHDENLLQKSREYTRQYVIPENKKKEEVFEYPENSPKYVLKTIWYRTTPGVIDVSRMIVLKDNKVLLDINRNHCLVWFHFIEDHPVTHKDYLLCGEDYQGYNVVNLTDKINHAFLPKAAGEGIGWCAVDVLGWCKEDMTLVVEGCYWAAPYEKRTLDFSNPESLPLPILKVEES